MTFRVNKSGSNKFPNFSPPKTVGYYSIDGTRSICYDSSMISYLYELPKNEKVNFNLNHGLHLVQRKPVLKENIDSILRWILNNVQLISGNPESRKWLLADFICFRGLLSRIIKTPYDEKEGWIICAAKWRGNIYLCEFDTEADKFESANRTAETKKFMSWGFKFEQYMLTATPNQPPDTSKPVNESEEFCCIFQSCLSNHSLLYGAEMDGVLAEEIMTDPLPLDKLKFIELKTNRIVEYSRQKTTLQNFKFLRWWCQCFLVGIETVLCGFRDDKGIVKELKDYRVEDLPKNQKFWNSGVMMNFCDNFLKYVAQTVVQDYDQVIYKFERIPHSDIVLTEVYPKSEYAFLPDWYTKTKK